MKWLIFLSFCMVLICFSAQSAEKEPEIKENGKYLVNFGFWVAKDAGSLDELSDAIFAGSKPRMQKMAEEKRIQKLQGKDKIIVKKAHSRNLGLPFTEAIVQRKGKSLGKVYIFTHFITSFCEPVK